MQSNYSLQVVRTSSHSSSFANAKLHRLCDYFKLHRRKQGGGSSLGLAGSEKERVVVGRRSKSVNFCTLYWCQKIPRLWQHWGFPSRMYPGRSLPESRFSACPSHLSVLPSRRSTSPSSRRKMCRLQTPDADVSTTLTKTTKLAVKSRWNTYWPTFTFYQNTF